MKEWLTEEQQYAEILNSEEISRIKDDELREIRMKHWNYRHKIFLNEQNISDQELMRLYDLDLKQEQREIELYKQCIK